MLEERMAGEGSYDDLAAFTHLIFKDWAQSIEWQGGVFGALIDSAFPGRKVRVLDCACGIGTQALGLAARGYRVTGSDLSAASVERARREASKRGLTIDLFVADMRDLAGVPSSGFDVVLAADNALPHLLTAEDRRNAARAIASKLNQGGLFIATLRDYDQIVEQHPAVWGPAFYTDDGRRRIMHQIWDWLDERRYTFHLYITRETPEGWESKHFVSHYRALLRAEVEQMLADGGFEEIRWMTAEESGYYQPVVTARKR